MNPLVKSSLLWGAIGAFSFLVLVQGYHLFSDDFLGLTPMLVGALVVLVVTAVLAHTMRPRLTGNESP
jgi:hypothetical protein